MNRTNATKLIVVEGFPGSGKTTTAQFVSQWLDDHGIANRTFLEGDLHHPADYEAVAYFPREAYEDLLARYPDRRDAIVQYTEFHEDDRFVGYWLIKNHHPIPDALFEEMAQQDIYAQPDFALQARLFHDRWLRFVVSALACDAVTIFECCVLQNPLTTTILQHNLTDAESSEFVQNILASIAPLKPLIVYLWQNDLRASLLTIAEERPKAWQDAVGAYVDRGAWAKAAGQGGFGGYIAAAEQRQAIELALLREGTVANTVVDVSSRDWAPAQAEVARILEKTFSVS